MKSQFEFERRSIKSIRNKHPVQSLIRGHHVYENVWSPYKVGTLITQPDNRDEAQENDKYAVGIYKKNDDGSKEWVGHAQAEFPVVSYSSREC